MNGLYHSLKTRGTLTQSASVFLEQGAVGVGETKSYVYTRSFPLGRCNVYTNVLLELIYCKNFLMI